MLPLSLLKGKGGWGERGRPPSGRSPDRRSFRHMYPYADGALERTDFVRRGSTPLTQQKRCSKVCPPIVDMNTFKLRVIDTSAGHRKREAVWGQARYESRDQTAAWLRSGGVD